MCNTVGNGRFSVNLIPFCVLFLGSFMFKNLSLLS
jgi:hypothetical protein